MTQDGPALTHFASAGRAPVARLQREIAALVNNDVMNALLRGWGGVVAVLNRERQVIAVNAALLEAFGIDDPSGALGLRLGEVIRCIHASEPPAGCGTTRACVSCGAAIATLACLEVDGPAERDCVVTLVTGGERLLRVRAMRIDVGVQRVTLVTMEDRTVAAAREELERAFLHDMSNLVQGVYGVADELASTVEGPASRLAGDALRMAERLCREVDMQRALVHGGDGLKLLRTRFDAGDVLDDVRGLFTCHPAMAGRRLAVSPAPDGAALLADRTLVVRIVSNMVTNALEASATGDEVRAWAEAVEDRVAFCVWNAQPIPERAVHRVFQRHFSTKGGTGRGVGTYSMRLFGETYLGGTVRFTTSADEGTTFRFTLPAA